MLADHFLVHAQWMDFRGRQRRLMLKLSWEGRPVIMLVVRDIQLLTIVTNIREQVYTDLLGPINLMVNTFSKYL